MSITPAADGFVHPAEEDELVELVREANRRGCQLRVRGAGHSVPGAIHTRPRGIDVMLDRYRDLIDIDVDRRLAVAEAGINLGVDKADPTHTSTLENSLLANLFAKGLTLPLPGGITHQTAGGFTATGSCGGSLRHSSFDNVHAFRVIDGTGEIHTFTRGSDAAFEALNPNLGLLGVVSQVTFQCEPAFAVAGRESVQPVAGASVDLFGSGERSLTRFLESTEYGRIEWWPQRGVERLITWSAARTTKTEFDKPPYDRFHGDDDLAQQAISVLYALLGNLEDPARAKQALDDNFDELARVLRQRSRRHHFGAVGDWAAGAVADVVEVAVDGGFDLAGHLRGRLQDDLPRYFPRLADIFLKLDSETGGPQEFEDWSWRALPMDNAVNDALLPTSFTEAWIPLRRTQDVMRLLRSYFEDPRDAHESYRRTGTFVWELYAARASSFWLSPSYATAEDDPDGWREGALRVNPYWFADSADDPARALFTGLWDLLRDNEIPFRLHWGKYQPPASPEQPEWVNWFAAQYPRWNDFLALRRELDPNGIFLTDYWRDRLGLWAQPRPVSRA